MSLQEENKHLNSIVENLNGASLLEGLASSQLHNLTPFVRGGAGGGQTSRISLQNRTKQNAEKSTLEKLCLLFIFSSRRRAERSMRLSGRGPGGEGGRCIMLEAPLACPSWPSEKLIPTFIRCQVRG